MYSVLVTTSDNYVGLIKLFIHHFRSNWPNENIKVIIIGETIVPNLESLDIKTALMGRKSNWSELVNFGLSFVITPYVFLLMEDAFLLSAVNPDNLTEIFSLSMKFNIDYLRLNVKSNVEDEFKITRFDYSKNRVSIVDGVWNVNFLKKILRKNENAWEFEFNSLSRMRLYSCNCYYSNLDLLNIPPGGVIVKGKLNNAIDVDKLLNVNNVSYEWEDINNLSGVVTEETPILRRIIKIPCRYLKLCFNLIFNNF